ncbi:hypothetical protein PsYK624_096190 [Phanerochaete sordida]|uniref:Uncharacterized protein n=1 Tax=Phanerochaete sordida TaxID=48140 RepID=A0A9P3LFN1_9APHY|nr:hypothetical protein PsYK624_096190 [Phanerochaete sordida]
MARMPSLRTDVAQSFRADPARFSNSSANGATCAPVIRRQILFGSVAAAALSIDAAVLQCDWLGCLHKSF